MGIRETLNAREGSVEIGGSRMDYAVFGSGRRNLLLIPGLSLRPVRGAAIPLAHMYRLFARDYRVWVFDRKADIPENCDIHMLSEDLARAAALVGIDEADAIGVSQGGMIAQRLAIDHPALIRRLVLAVTLSRPNDTLRAVIDGWTRMAGTGNLEGIVRDMLERVYSPEYVRRWGRLFPLLVKTVKLNEPERFIRLARACLTADTYGELDRIHCPVLVLGGREDRVVTAEASEEIAARLGCPIYMYEGLGHSAYEEAPDFNQRALAFLNGVNIV